jgi:2-polyprenyl-3-methyl-5-hydroxy-6-metoxy-1,4-benzoquinol methylase
MAHEEIERADFERYFPFTPTALAIKECARLTALRRYECHGPILDVGCGDGLFASIAWPGAEVWGIDIDGNEGRWAAASQAYVQIVLGDVTRAKLPENFFQTCVANCSLEHVPRIDMALKNIHNGLRPGGVAYLFVPNRDWARYMLSARLLSALGAARLSERLTATVDRVFRHHHLHDEAGWRSIVSGAGLEIVRIEPVLSSATTVAFELFLLPSLAGLVNKNLTTRWTNFPAFRRALLAAPVHKIVEAVMARLDDERTAEFLIVARRAE